MSSGLSNRCIGLALAMSPLCMRAAFGANLPAAPQTQPVATLETFEALDRPLEIGQSTGDVARWLKEYERTPERFQYTIEPIKTEPSLRVSRLTFPSAAPGPWPENNVVPCELYQPPAATDAVVKHPAAIVLDILSGSALVARVMARTLAERGVVAVYMPMSCYGPRRPKGDVHIGRMLDDSDLAIRNFRQSVMDIRRLKAILASQPTIDPDRLGITGISLGGITATLAAGVDGSFNRVVPILAGGDLSDILFHARETRRIREALSAKGIDCEKARVLFAGVEPLHFASRIAPASCLMINADQDEVIPKDDTLALNKAIGSPRILWSPMGHYSSVFYLPTVCRRTAEFMQGKEVKSLDVAAN